MTQVPTYIVRWYVNGKADVALVAESNEDLAHDVVKVKLERMGVSPDRGKIRLTLWEPRHMDFHLLSHGGRV